MFKYDKRRKQNKNSFSVVRMRGMCGCMQVSDNYINRAHGVQGGWEVGGRGLGGIRKGCVSGGSGVGR